jgi:hypothetical protein
MTLEKGSKRKMFTITFKQTNIVIWQECQRNVVRFENMNEHDKRNTLSVEGAMI